MVPKLIKFLGGYTQEEFNQFTIIEQQRKYDLENTFNQNFNIATEYLKAQIEKKDVEIKRLTDLILTEHGVIRNSVPRQFDTKPQPINKRESPQQRLLRLQKEDAERHSQMLKDRWKDKIIPDSANSNEPKSIEELEKTIGLNDYRPSKIS